MTTETTACDVLVAGGGSAGVAAAVGAARAGATVILAEELAYAGGQAASAEVGTVCGLYHRRRDGPATFACAGFPREFGEALRAAGRTEPMLYDQGLWFLPYDPPVFRALCVDFLSTSGITFLPSTRLEAAEATGTALTFARLSGPGGDCTIRPGAVVDATGGATLARLAGAALLSEPDPQTGALVFTLDGLPALDPRTLQLHLLSILTRAVHDGRLEEFADRVSPVPGSLRDSIVRCKLSLPDLSAEAPARLEAAARARAARIVACLKTNPLFAGIRLAALADRVGVRSAPRTPGRAVLTEEDVLGGRRFPDGVAVGAWPVEFWGREPRPIMAYAPEGATYEIPLGALVAADFDNLFLAGRGLSATGRAAASARVIGTCLGTGYAAGFAAAGRVRGVPEPEIVRLLRGQMGMLSLGRKSGTNPPA